MQQTETVTEHRITTEAVLYLQKPVCCMKEIGRFCQEPKTDFTHHWMYMLVLLDMTFTVDWALDF